MELAIQAIDLRRGRRLTSSSAAEFELTHIKSLGLMSVVVWV